MGCAGYQLLGTYKHKEGVICVQNVLLTKPHIVKNQRYSTISYCVSHTECILYCLYYK